MSDHRRALARTSLLINAEFFDGEADQGLIADALLDSCVRLRAGYAAMRSRAGQTTLITAFSLLARSGIGVELAVANEPLLDRVSPLCGELVVDALVELGSDLIPGASVRRSSGVADESISIGAEGAAAGDIVVSVGDFGCWLERGSGPRFCQGDLPLGGFAAAAAIAAIALEATLPRIEATTGLRARTPRPSSGPPVQIDLRDLFPGLGAGLRLGLGEIDAVSGGAITNAMLFCLLRVPGLEAAVRVIEADIAELSNVNRYLLLRASEAGATKIDLLESASTRALQIRGERSLFTRQSRASLEPLAPRVLVGADDVRARWWVQESDPSWLAVGATGNHLAQLTVHLPSSPCAACLHPVALPPDLEIPTISFVSFWAGLLQACALLAGEEEPRNLSVFPFALGAPVPWISAVPTPAPACQMRCRCSRPMDRDAA